LAELDREAFLWVVEHRVGWLDPVFVALSAAGFAGVVWVGLAAALAVWSGRAILTVVATTAAAVWSADLLALAAKELTGRSRPFAAFPEVDPLLGVTVGGSLPSGHAATSFAGAVVLSYFFRRALPALVVLAVLIAFSRVYVGVHYPLDVLAGAALGTLVGAGFVVLAVRALRRPSEVPPQSGEIPPPG
jgi:undecaprenyl-diphosphatase